VALDGCHLRQGHAVEPRPRLGDQIRQRVLAAGGRQGAEDVSALEQTEGPGYLTGTRADQPAEHVGGLVRALHVDERLERLGRTGRLLQQPFGTSLEDIRSHRRVGGPERRELGRVVLQQLFVGGEERGRPHLSRRLTDPDGETQPDDEGNHTPEAWPGTAVPGTIVRHPSARLAVHASI